MKKTFIKTTKIKIYFFLFIILSISSSFFVQTPNEVIVPKVNSDLSWIKQYTSIYNLFNQDQWEKNPTRSFDSVGVHLSKGNYHPVNACHYALYCYDEYLTGKNDRFKKAFLAQVSYLRDSSKYHERDGDKVGYPYLVAFHDLVPPWYSSLAQGEAISVLIRYYALTKDATVLPLIVKIKNFMLNPMQKGGCFNIIPEGYEWFEEYPNSKQEAHNFSGYYIAVIAMGEYAQLFPDDTASVNLYKRTVYGGKMNNKIYDSGSGIYYNRGDKRLCAPSYLKWMTNLMGHMYEFSSDDFFKSQRRIWSTYSSGKDYVDVGVIKDYYNWSIPIIKTADNKFICTDPTEKIVAASVIKECKAENKIVYVGTVLDGNAKTAIKLNGTNEPDESKAVSFLFAKTIESSTLEIKLQKDSSNHKLKISLFYRSGTNEKWNTMKKLKLENNSNEILKCDFEKIKLSALKIVFEDKYNTALSVSEIKIIESIAVAAPEFMFYKTGQCVVTNGTQKLTCEFEPDIEHWIYSRSANTSKELASTPFPAGNVLEKNTLTINTKDKLVEYLIMCQYKKGSNGIKKLEIQ